MQQLIMQAQTPDAPLIGMAALMRCAMRGEHLAPLEAALLQRLRQHPQDAHALLDYAILLQLLGSPDMAMLMQYRALHLRTLYARPGKPPALLVVMGPGQLMWNTPIELLLEGQDLAVDFLYLTDDHPWPVTPPVHALAFVAMAESQRNRSLLARLEQRMAHWPCRVINRPERIAGLTRDGVSTLLQGIPGLSVPPSRLVERDTLMACDDFPFIARPHDSHAGRDLVLLRSPQQTAGYLESLAEQQFYITPFVDYRSADGQYRKYRVVLIDGQPFLGHLAISSHWLVHYLNAGMDASAAKRAEEAACMAGFDTGFAVRHAPALQALHQRLGLEYLVIDCAELPSGALLLFEAGTAMSVHAMDDLLLYPYKQAAMHKIFAAFGRMLAGASAGHG